MTTRSARHAAGCAIRFTPLARICRVAGLAVALTLSVGATWQADPDSRWLGISDMGAWSPDGERIAFHSTRDGNFEIYVMRADGSELRRLTHNPWADFWPSFSPDGAEIAFTSDREGWVSTPSRNQIYLMRSDGTEVRKLTDQSFRDHEPGTASSNNTFPVFHPDGWIVFLSDRANGWNEIYRIERDGSNTRRLSHARTHHYNLGISADGSWLLFDHHVENYPTAAIRDGGWELHTMPTIGGPQRDLTANRDYEDYDGAISPDGTRIVYKRVGYEGLFIMDADGSGQSPEPWYDDSAFSPRWSPEGNRLLFTSTRDGHREIYVMDVRDRSVRRLTYSRPK